ncbi:MAG: beta-N-acetylhexosaminidase [Opitutaceae bacterium]|jgi:hexosaminidase|nr:beta-N-acetylhexosaminidase [Opitutaceae bacterium]
MKFSTSSILDKTARAFAGAFVFFAASSLSLADVTADIIPLPAEIRFSVPEARLPITGDFSVALAGINDIRLRSAITRLYSALSIRTGIVFTQTSIVSSVARDSALIINVHAPAPAIPALGEDETYTLAITPEQAVLRAPTTTGALRGLQTIIQLIRQDAGGFSLPAVTINDRPRFPWRGLMIDVSRHWHDTGDIRRVIDGMELVKLNVLHLHLTDDQGFRIESKTHPELHMLGSDGLYFTQDQIRGIIDYATARAIRVVPEFDMPGHATSWGISHPELLSGSPGTTYTIEQRWGVFDPTMDPSNPALHELLSDFLGEMAALFPDPFMHIGGDENNGRQWNASERIQKFIAENNLKDNHGLHSWFNTRLAEILARNNKTLVGWDEILHSGLPQNAVVHSWRGAKGVAEAAAAGHRVILSHGYYIDLNQPASDHYGVDPLPAGDALAPDRRELVLGGEATMWSEWVSPETIDSRIWPRTAAIAERLWSPRAARDVFDMYRRLAIVSLRLDEAGMMHEKNRSSLLRRLAGDAFAPASPEVLALRVFSDACEPVKQYARGRLQLKSRLNPLGGFVDATVPDSASARDFNNNVSAYLETRKTDPEKAPALADALRGQLAEWHQAAQSVSTRLAERSPRLKDVAKFANGVLYAIEQTENALLVLEKVPSEEMPSADAKATRDQQLAAVDKAVAPNTVAVEFPALKGIKQLITAAAQNTASP